VEHGLDVDVGGGADHRSGPDIPVTQVKSVRSARYISYYHDDRTHLGLDKQTPAGRARSRENGTVICQQRVGGLHHRYDRAA